MFISQYRFTSDSVKAVVHGINYIVCIDLIVKLGWSKERKKMIE